MEIFADEMEVNMELNQAIASRRSIRKFKDKPVGKGLVERIIAAAQEAPSWKNSQTSRFYVVMEEGLAKKVKKECLPEFNANNVANAPVLIVTSFVKDISGFDNEGVPRNECGNGWGYYDLGLATQNLLLEARNLDIDTLIMGIRDSEKLREILNIPDTETIVSVIGVGYRDVTADMPNRKKIDEISKFFE